MLQLGNFTPPLPQELIENLCKDELPKSEYSCINEPRTNAREASRAGAQSSQAPTSQSTGPHSMRSRRTANWARPRLSDDENSR